jgi:hypothetical protein
MQGKISRPRLRDEWRKMQARSGPSRLPSDFLKLTILYTIGIIATFIASWVMLVFAMPEAKLDMLQTLTTAFGINLPDNMPLTLNTTARQFIVILIIAFLSLTLVILNVFFSAVVTARFIRPRVQLVTSARGVLSTTWNQEMPYLLVRMSNFYAADLVDVTANVVLMIEETRLVNGQIEEFRSYLPINDFTPQRILVMEQRMPWSLAVPAETHLGNSLNKDYLFAPGKPIGHSFSKGKTILSAKRTLEILLQGTDARSYSSFVIHRKIPIDEQKGDKYTLHLHRGSFKSLPLKIEDPAEIEQYV